ncbi:MAG: hypothetical protein ACK4RK_15140 [Gemmataceae bacterium]
MLGRSLTMGALAVAAVFVGAGSAAAQGTFRLDLNAGGQNLLGLGGGATTMTLQIDNQTVPADTQQVWGWRGYYRPYYYRPYYGGYYPRYYSYYRPYYYGGFSYGYSYYPRYYYAPGGYYYGGWGYYRLSGDADICAGPAVVYEYPPITTPAQPQQPAAPPPNSSPNNGTFQYDGGPSNPVPMPKTNPATNPVPTILVPLEGKLVSLPARPAAQPTYVYPAYGEGR